MHDGPLNIDGKARTICIAVSLAMLLFLTMLSARSLLAAYYYGKVTDILDDRSSVESVTIKELSAETMPAYQEVIETISKAAVCDPSRSLYPKAISDIYSKLGNWTETMELLKAAIPPGAMPSQDALNLAAEYIRMAVKQQPMKPDHHLAYGHLSREAKDVISARSEYQLTVRAYPWNSPLRYAVAMEYLAAGMLQDAQAHAIELANIDDSYRLTDPETERLIREKRTPAYITKLRVSYLFKAIEVIWRASGNNINEVRSAVPDNDEAQDALEMFIELKGIAAQ